MNCFDLFIRWEPSNLFLGCLETLGSVLHPFTAMISSLLFCLLSARPPSLYRSLLVMRKRHRPHRQTDVVSESPAYHKRVK